VFDAVVHTSFDVTVHLYEHLASTSIAVGMLQRLPLSTPLATR
jgi:hypothetical protein